MLNLHLSIGPGVKPLVYKERATKAAHQQLQSSVSVTLHTFSHCTAVDSVALTSQYTITVITCISQK